MKNIKQTCPATWLAGGAVALSASAADAALVKVDLNHDLTTTLDNVDFGFGLGVDDHDWHSVRLDVDYATVFFSTHAHRSVYLSFARFFFGDSARAGTSLSGVRNVGDGGFLTVMGLVAWNLRNGTEGWLHVTASSRGSGFVRADYFAFDDDFIGVTGGRAAGNLTHGGDSEAFAGAANFTGTGVPEPSSLALLALGAAGVMGRRNRKATAA